MNAKKLVLATAAASIFLSAPFAMAADEKAGEKIICEGVNACKGQSACKAGANTSCKGKNACKGKGVLSVTKEECDALKAEAKKG